MSSKYCRFALAWLFLIVMVASARVCPTQQNHEKRLSDISHRVSDYDWSKNRHWMWKSDHEAIYSVVADKALNLVLLDTNTGNRTPLTALNTKYRDLFYVQPSNGLTRSRPSVATFRLSPDGKSLLFHPGSFASDGVHNCPCVVVGLDGTNERRFNSSIKDFPSEMAWMLDSHSWVEAEYGGSGSTLQKYTVWRPSNPLTSDTRQVRDQDRRGAVVYFGPLSADLVCSMTDETLVGVFATVYSLSDRSVMKTFSITLPRQMELLGCAVSPETNQIAWLAFEELVSPGAVDTILVSNLKGEHMREVGHMRVANMNDIDDLKWLPGGTKVSYLYHKGIYIVPVDK